MRLDEPIEGIWISAFALSNEEILHRVRETVEGRLKIGGLTLFAMCPSQGYLSLGMRYVRASPPPVPKDAAWQVVNQARAKAQKKRKDAEEAKRTRKILEHEGLEKRHRQQRQDGLPVESSLSPSLSTDALNRDDESKMGRGPLDHLPNVGETALGALASSPALLGGGGEDASGPVIARPRAKADTPKARALGKRVVSPVGSMVEVEQVAAGATQLPPQRIKGASESNKSRPAPADTEAMPSPPPPPLQRRVMVPKWLHPRSSRKHLVEVPTLAPHKALKVSPSSTAHRVVEAQATIQRGATSASADPKEPVAQGEAAKAALTQAGEGAPMPHEAEAYESDGAKAPSVAEATEGETEAPRTSEAKAMEARAPRTTEADVAGTGAPETIEARVARTGAPETTEAGVAGTGMSAVKPAVQEAEAEELETQSLRKSLFLRWERDVWDQLQRQKGLLTDANELLSARSAEVEDLRLCLEKEASRAVEASVTVQVVLEAEIEGHDALKSAARTMCEALEVEGA
ncbi:uncharacterized protein [Miscanthus floridulus]|uniref:uncharacterized protein n=1 Tax=Miscanthus floridulus TaxID=154761 RepID=UPI00345A8414